MPNPNWTDFSAEPKTDWRFDWTGDLDDLSIEQADELDAEMDRARRCSDLESEWDFPPIR